MSLRHSQKGFTLIEIMVALLILAGLSVLIAQSIRTGLNSRTKIQVQLDEEAQIRDAMKLMVSDVGSAFHHRDFTVSVYNKVLEVRKKQAAAKTATPTPNPAAGAAPPGFPPTTNQNQQPDPNANPTGPDPLASATPMPAPKQMTGFKGNANELTLTVYNHVRRYRNAPESDQARVSYFTRTCKSSDQKSSSTCLVRVEKPDFDDKLPLPPTSEDADGALVLVQNVTNFKLRYIVAGTTDFLDSWDSGPDSANDKMKDQFPDAVEISLSLHNKNNPQSKPRTLTWLAPIRFANNIDEAEKKEKEQAAAAAAAGGQQGTGAPPQQPTGRAQ